MQRWSIAWFEDISDGLGCCLGCYFLFSITNNHLIRAKVTSNVALENRLPIMYTHPLHAPDMWLMRMFSTHTCMRRFSNDRCKNMYTISVNVCIVLKHTKLFGNTTHTAAATRAAEASFLFYIMILYGAHIRTWFSRHAAIDESFPSSHTHTQTSGRTRANRHGEGG